MIMYIIQPNIIQGLGVKREGESSFVDLFFSFLFENMWANWTKCSVWFRITLLILNMKVFTSIKEFDQLYCLLGTFLIPTSVNKPYTWFITLAFSVLELVIFPSILEALNPQNEDTPICLKRNTQLSSTY